MKLFNTLTKQKDDFKPLSEGQVGIYTCGPTVYGRAHIGNLASFIMADTLRRLISANGFEVEHVMNITDVDDKTIARSAELYPKLAPTERLKELTTANTEEFLSDMTTIGNDTSRLTFIKATDDKSIAAMKNLIIDLYKSGFAYLADDGVYFSIDKYRKSGKKYGQLAHVGDVDLAKSRISNDEYDKQSAQDFALWKIKKEGEPYWDFDIDGHDLAGRPGWHIECSAMSASLLGQPFDIHTGGIDLIFPHHENEIAQSTAGNDLPYANFFLHNEHILVDGKKMAKSLNNFVTLSDLKAKGFDPISFRLLVLQSHYRSQANFSWESLEAANNRLKSWRDIAVLRWQTHSTLEKDSSRPVSLLATSQAILEALSDDIDTPRALSIIDEAFSRIQNSNPAEIHHYGLVSLLKTIDESLGLDLLDSTPDIDDEAKMLILEREQARNKGDWSRSDDLRAELLKRGISLRDGEKRSIWAYAGSSLDSSE